MAEIVNLRMARKAKARKLAEAEAAASRARHGRTPAERCRDAEEAARREILLDQVRLEKDGARPQGDGVGCPGTNGESICP